MKNLLLNIIYDYLKFFPNEKEKQTRFIEFLKNHDDIQTIDWNNFDGHVVAGGFVYAKKEQKFLVVYHNDLEMYLYPGGHINQEDENPLEAAKREVYEETGISVLKSVVLLNNDLIPIDIDTHLVSYNQRLNLPEHYHYEFRYLFIIDSIQEVRLDQSELSEYKWINKAELKQDKNYGKVVEKINLLVD